MNWRSEHIWIELLKGSRVEHNGTIGIENGARTKEINFFTKLFFTTENVTVVS